MTCLWMLQGGVTAEVGRSEGCDDQPISGRRSRTGLFTILTLPSTRVPSAAGGVSDTTPRHTMHLIVKVEGHKAWLK